MFNLQTAGFYRVNYDDENWELLLDNYYEFPELTRAQLINDALNIAKANQLNYNIALRLLKSISKDLYGFLSWKSALSEFQFLHDMLAFSPAYGDFEVSPYKLKYVRNHPFQDSKNLVYYSVPSSTVRKLASTSVLHPDLPL